MFQQPVLSRDGHRYYFGGSHNPQPQGCLTAHLSMLCSCTVLLEVEYALEMEKEVNGTLSRGGLQNKLDDLEVCSSH